MAYGLKVKTHIHVKISMQQVNYHFSTHFAPTKTHEK